MPARFDALHGRLQAVEIEVIERDAGGREFDRGIELLRRADEQMQFGFAEIPAQAWRAAPCRNDGVEHGIGARPFAGPETSQRPRGATDSAPIPGRTASLPHRARLASSYGVLPRRPNCSRTDSRESARLCAVAKRGFRRGRDQIAGVRASDHSVISGDPAWAKTRTWTGWRCTGAEASVKGRAAWVTSGSLLRQTRSPGRMRSKRIARLANRTGGCHGAARRFVNAPALFRFTGTAPVGRVEHQAIAFLQRRDLVCFRHFDHHAIGPDFRDAPHQHAPMPRRAAFHNFLMIVPVTK